MIEYLSIHSIIHSSTHSFPMSDHFRNRQIAIQVFFVVAALGLMLKALQLQVLDSTFKTKADAAIMDKHVLYPARGLVLDRNGESLILNTPMYDLMVTYNQIGPEIDVNKFCDLLKIDTSYYRKALKKNWKSSRYSKSVPFVFLSKIPAETIAAFRESMYQFPGFFVQRRYARDYPKPIAAHLLGYIKEVNRKEVIDSVDIYKPGDYIGASGLELYYEHLLRGNKGEKFILKDHMGREVGDFDEGQRDIKRKSGKTLITSIDINLQAYGEELMQNKIGSIVAIQPQTGEILAMVSSPTYDPNKLTINNNRGKEYQKLAQDSLQPFFDRSVMAQYPPGSLFKIVVALAGMQEGVLDANRTIQCAGGYYLNGERLVGCHGHPTCTNVSMSIQHSCNAYFVTVFREIVDQFGFGKPHQGLDNFNEYVELFGIGKKLGIDFPREKKGNYPTSKYYKDYFERQQAGQRWNSVWIRSLGIGQGELLSTNLQLANLAAIIANRGYYYTPHLVKRLRNEDNTEEIIEAFTEPHSVGVDSVHFPPVVLGMENALRAGTAGAAFIRDIPICGKTGTAENNQGNGKDHSIFMAFAPKDNPQIAIAVYLENGGWGGSYAAPIASLIIEKHIRGFIHPDRTYLENRMLNANLIDTP